MFLQVKDEKVSFSIACPFPHCLRAHSCNHPIRFEVFTAGTMKTAVFWDVTLCGSCKKRCFGGTWRLQHQKDKNR
jgi:hypothetical protein